MAEGVKLMLGTSKFQVLQEAAEPYLSIQSVGPFPIGVLIGVAGGVLTLLLLENKKFPGGLLVVLGGIGLGVILGTHQGLDKIQLGLTFPSILPFGFPKTADFTFAFFALVLPQIPMTMGNAVIAYADLSREYFGDNAKKVTYRGACLSMALANFLSFFLGGMPLCHGAGGLAAHYRFGARTAGSNIMIGLVFAGLAVLLGDHVLAVVNLLPMAVLGVLLLFAGSQLALSVIDIRERKELFVVLMILGITLASNLAVGFIVGIGVAYALKADKLRV
jgi:SulP family sulfate permease